MKVYTNDVTQKIDFFNLKHFSIQIKEIIAETLKHAPNKAGGSNWLKVTYYCQNLIL